MKNIKFKYLLLLSFIDIKPCFSQFFVKNELAHDIYVSTANYYVTKPGTGSVEGWGTKGWALIRPNQTVAVLERIDNRFVYVYADHPYFGTLLQGDTPFRVENFDTKKNFGPLWRCHGEWLFRTQNTNPDRVSATPLFQKVDTDNATYFTFTIKTR